MDELDDLGIACLVDGQRNERRSGVTALLEVHRLALMEGNAAGIGTAVNAVPAVEIVRLEIGQAGCVFVVLAREKLTVAGDAHFTGRLLGDLHGVDIAVGIVTDIRNHDHMAVWVIERIADAQILKTVRDPRGIRQHACACAPVREVPREGREARAVAAIIGCGA